MDVVVVGCRQVVVDDVADVGNIEASGGDIGRDQYLDVAILEHVERFLPAGLGLIAVN